MRLLTFCLSFCLLIASSLLNHSVLTPEPLAALAKTATIELGGSPDWMAITKDAVWVSNDQLKAVQRIDPIRNRVAARIDFQANPCSGLGAGFESVWVPLCGSAPRLARIRESTYAVEAVLPFGPVDDEGGITTSPDSVWIVTGKGQLSRIDPRTNALWQEIHVPEESANPLFAYGAIWVTDPAGGALTVVDADTGKIAATIPVGPHPRFLTSGAGSVWVLNQGNGDITRVDASKRRVIATIQAGIAGKGGEIFFGAGSIWATVFNTPLTQVDATSNQLLRQWTGPGGDSVRYGHGSIWLTDLRKGLLWRIEPPK